MFGNNEKNLLRFRHFLNTLWTKSINVVEVDCFTAFAMTEKGLGRKKKTRSIVIFGQKKAPEFIQGDSI